jgi:NTP pyrophosphatase (non-canonical NTP hydrolase)
MTNAAAPVDLVTHARGADFLTHLQEVGAARARRWHPTPAQEFTGLEWAGAMCGEAGEAANVAKKLRRLELAIAGNDASERPALPPELIAKLGRELADTLIYMVNVASHYGVNLADVTVEAFNNKSIEMGFPERISRTPAGHVRFATDEEVERFTRKLERSYHDEPLGPDDDLNPALIRLFLDDFLAARGPERPAPLQESSRETDTVRAAALRLIEATGGDPDAARSAIAYAWSESARQAPDPAGAR